jgi:hypothetical protein
MSCCLQLRPQRRPEEFRIAGLGVCDAAAEQEDDSDHEQLQRQIGNVVF